MPVVLVVDDDDRPAEQRGFVAWHTYGIARTRLSTTVDAELRDRSAELDASYAAYDEHPLDEPDEWGDLASFREAAAAS